MQRFAKIILNVNIRLLNIESSLKSFATKKITILSFLKNFKNTTFWEINFGNMAFIKIKALLFSNCIKHWSLI